MVVDRLNPTSRRKDRKRECHVKHETKRILAYVPGLQRKNENQGPERYHVGELSSVLPEMQSCNESRLRKIEYGVERRSRRIDAGQDKAINERRNDRENPLCILVAVAMYCAPYIKRCR